MKISDKAIYAAMDAYASTDYYGMRRILEAACPIVMEEKGKALESLAEASANLLIAYARTSIDPEHKPAWKGLIAALKDVKPFLEEK